MNNNIFKFIALPVVLLSTILTGCNNSTPVQSDEITYRDVIIEDYLKNPPNPEHINNANNRPDLKIDRSYIFVDGGITFTIELSLRLGVDYKFIFFDDIEMSISHGTVPLYWKNHEIITLPEAYRLGYYTREDMLTIKHMYENKENDFSFLDLPFKEEVE